MTRPGPLALRRWLPSSNRLEAAVFSVAASLCTAVLLSLVLSLAHVLSTGLGLACLAALTSLAAVASRDQPVVAYEHRRGADG